LRDPPRRLNGRDRVLDYSGNIGASLLLAPSIVRVTADRSHKTLTNQCAKFLL